MFLIHEVGMRDGLQMEKQIVPFETKVKWIEKMLESNVDIIQLGSFVHKEKMPQMADSDKLFNYFNKKKHNTIFSGLALNEKGMERAFACGVDLLCLGVSASETHSKKNTGMTVEDATSRIINIAKESMKAGVKVQTSVQSALGCGFEGIIPEERVLNIIKKYLDAGIRKISLADTAGYGNPAQVERIISEIKRLDCEVEIACHFHNTYGMGLANCYAAMKAGATVFESSTGGLGGCPFTKLAAGNVCTEDLINFFNQMDLRKDIVLNIFIDLAKEMSEFFQRDLPGYVYKAGVIKK